MKRLLIVIMLLIPVVLSVQKTKTKEPVKAPGSVVNLSNAANSSQYILGVYIGQYLRTDNLKIMNRNRHQPGFFNHGLLSYLIKKLND